MSASVPGLTSIIIPTYNHGALVLEAIESALRQEAPVEVIVINDGSTDGTAETLSAWDGAGGLSRVRVLTIHHSGPSAARNVGLAHARGEYVTFLDADDLIAPTKVADQTRVLASRPEVGWVLCDVRIEDANRRRSINASEQYGYATKDLGGWIAPQLRAGNFIPVMSPIIRRAVLGDQIRFNDSEVPEDWHFWLKVAAVARVKYLPKVLATYRHQRTGRSRLPKSARAVVPNIDHPIRLNLGCGTPGTRSWHPIAGFVNLDKSLGWRFEDGLGEFINGASNNPRSVHGITISHALMYLPLEHWPAFFAEVARVLAPGGVVRITEDDAISPASSRRGGWQGSDPAITLTDAELVKMHLELVGLEAREVTRDETTYADRSLCQSQHGDPPDVFFVEGRRRVGVLFSPHNDDETLFASYTILRHRPEVVVCFPSAGDYGTTETRTAETREALEVLGAHLLAQWSGLELVAHMLELDSQLHPEIVWAPSEFSTHPDHVAVARAARAVFGGRVAPGVGPVLRHYHTYLSDPSGPMKVTIGARVPFEPEWPLRKSRALDCYVSQITHPRAGVFFSWDHEEYLE